MFIGIANSIGQRLGAGIDPNAQAFLSAAGITGATETAAVNTLVTSLKVYGIWSKMKALYPFVTDNSNLLGYTEDFSNGYWQKSGATVTANDTTAPNGTLTADKVVFGAANNYIQGSYTAATGLGNCYHSIWIKGTAGETIHVDDGYIAIPNVTLTGDWQQIQFYSDRGIGQNQGIGIGTYNGATARTIWLWGAQVSIGSSPVTYQPIATTQQSYISSQFKYNLKDPRDLDAAFRLVFNGGWTHSANGATPNGTNGYANTFLLPSTQLTNNNSHLSFYSRTNIDLSTGCDIGTSTGGSFIPIFALYSRASNVFRCNAYNYNAGSVLDISNNNSTGFYTNNRTSSTVLNGWKNGLKLGTATYTNTDNLTSIDKNIFIGCLNLNGSAGQYSSREVAFASIGDGLSDTEASNLYTAVQAFQTSLSRQV